MYKITAKLQSNITFNPANSYDKYIIEKELKVGEHYVLKITKARSIKSLGNIG